MKKILLFTAVMLMLGSAYAEKISDTQARQIGEKFILSNTNLAIKSVSDLSLIYTFYSGEQPRIYVYNIGNEGFVMISADNCVRPVVAYSTEGVFNADNMAPAMQNMIENEYVAAMDYVIDNQIATPDEIINEWASVTTTGKISAVKASTAVTPLLSTNWNQDCYYNTQCPTDASAANSCGHVYAGCVATAMAQIMRYWEYPSIGQGSHSYTHQTYGTQSVNFATQMYNYAQMPNSISTENANVARLIYNCAVSVDMDFGPQGSGAASADVPNAMTTYFDYVPNLTYSLKSSFTDANWISKIKGNLDAGIPVYYSGQSSNGGHAFICDGYNDQGQFHMNWGWSGSENGYFLLSNLATSQGAFNTQQGAIFDMIPANLCAAPQLVEVEVNNHEVTVNWEPSTTDDALSYLVFRDGVVKGVNITETSFVDTDVPNGIHCYKIKTQCANNIMSQYSAPVCDTVSQCPIITNFSTSTIDDKVTLSWSPVTLNNVEKWLKYDNETAYSTNIGTGSPFYLAVKFTPADLAAYAGAKITKVAYFNAEATNAYFYIYQGATTTQANMRYQQPFTATASHQYSQLTLPNPVTLDVTKPLWLVIYYNSSDYVGPVSAETTSANARQVSADGTSWDDFANLGLGTQYTNMIRCFVTTFSKDSEMASDNDKSVVGYNIYRDFELLATTTQTSYVDQGLTIGQEYCYSIRTQCSNGESEDSQFICITGGVNSVDEQQLETVVLYPNPNNGTFRVEYEGMKHLSVFNALGQNVLSRELDSDIENIDMSGFDSGMYLLYLTTEKGSVSKRFVIQ